MGGLDEIPRRLANRQPKPETSELSGDVYALPRRSRRQRCGFGRMAVEL